MTTDPFLDFTRSVADLLTDGESNDEGIVFTMEPDDAIATLHSLIGRARRIIEANDLEKLYRRAYRLGYGDSNDDEISAWRDAAEAAAERVGVNITDLSNAAYEWAEKKELL